MTEALTDAPLREVGFCLQTSSPVPYCLVPAGKIGDTLNAFLLNSIMEQVSQVRKPVLMETKDPFPYNLHNFLYAFSLL